MGESKRELTIRMLKENACMFNSCLAKDELKHFKNYDFVQYLINCLSIPEHNHDNCHNVTCRRKCEKDGYNKAIDDFEQKLLEKAPRNYAGDLELGGSVSFLSANAVIKIAEQLKVGESE